MDAARSDDHRCPVDGRRRVARIEVLARVATALAALVAAGTAAFGATPLAPALERLAHHPLEATLHELLDDVRAREGVPPLAPSETLALAARHHALEMIELGYVDHTSPTPGRRTPGDRVALAGGTMVTVGENLAVVGPPTPDVGQRVMRGWLDSPGHRANLLRPDWTHVGHGVVESADGRLVAVQVFARDPVPLVSVEAALGGSARLRLELVVRVARDGLVVVGTGGLPGQAVDAAAGTELALTVDGIRADERTSLQVGWSPAQGQAAVVEATGWFDPAAGSLDLSRPGSGAAPALEVVSWRASAPVQPVQLELAFGRDADELVVLVDGAPAGTIVEGARVRLTVPGDARSELTLGLLLGDGRLEVLHALEVEPRGGGGVAVWPAQR